MILGLGGAFLFYSGNLLWIESRLKRQKNLESALPQQRNDAKAIANLTVGACLGGIIDIFAIVFCWIFYLVLFKSEVPSKHAAETHIILWNRLFFI